MNFRSFRKPFEDRYPSAHWNTSGKKCGHCFTYYISILLPGPPVTTDDESSCTTQFVLLCVRQIFGSLHPTQSTSKTARNTAQRSKYMGITSSYLIFLGELTVKCFLINRPRQAVALSLADNSLIEYKRLIHSYNWVDRSKHKPPLTVIWIMIVTNFSLQAGSMSAVEGTCLSH